MTAIQMATAEMTCASFLGFGAEWDSRNYVEAGVTNAEFIRIRRRVEWMRLPVARIMMQIRWCMGVDGTLDFETPEMQSLYRHLDTCQALGTTVFLTDWGCMPEWLRVPGIRDVAAPRYAEVIGEYMQHLVDVRGYGCILYFIMVNEPNWEVQDFALWRLGLEGVATEFKKRGLAGRVLLAGSDEAHSADNVWHRQAVDQVSHLLGVYDMHRYASDVNEVRSGKLEEFWRTMWAYARDRDPDAAGKPCIVGEAGLGDDAQHPYGSPHIDEFAYGVFMADYAIQAARAGSAAVFAWMLDDNSHPGFFWGMWASLQDGLRLRPWFYPWALLSRLFPSGCSTYRVPEESPDLRLLVAKHKYTWSVCAVNRGDVELARTFDFTGSAHPAEVTLYRYCEGSSPVNAEGFPVSSGCEIVASNAVHLVCPPRSVTFLTVQQKT